MLDTAIELGKKYGLYVVVGAAGMAIGYWMGKPSDVEVQKAAEKYEDKKDKKKMKKSKKEKKMEKKFFDQIAKNEG